jgi:hypothetical protein
MLINIIILPFVSYFSKTEISISVVKVYYIATKLGTRNYLLDVGVLRLKSKRYLTKSYIRSEATET